ncbi:TPA: restriction endonuclease subunit S [Vibrio campbellii]|nr:restriction endonuclease subunit S [Vibrio campbellii]
MGSDFTTSTLEDMCELIVDCPHSTPKWTDSGVVVLRNQNIRNGVLDLSSPSYTDEAGYLSRVKRAVPQAGDIVITREAPMGEVCVVPKGLKCCLGQRQVLLRPKRGVSTEYLFWALQSPYVQHQVSWNEGTGTTVSNIRIPVLKAFKIPRQGEAESKIAKPLSDIADKIQVNTQINQTLEQMAQTLFKSWFVDFDPVIDNALDAGSDIPEVFETRVERRKAVRESADFKPLPDDVRRLFPSEFEESELGWMPKGWRSVDLTKMVDSISVTYPLKEVDKVIFLNTGDIDNGKFLVNEYSDSKGLPGQAKKSIQENDILFSEIRPKNKRFAFVNFDASDYVVSTKLMVLRAKNGFEPLLPYFLVTHDRTTTELQRVAELRSGTFPQITYKELEFISFLLPPNGGLLDFFVNKHLKPIYERSFSFSEENQTLEKLRDTLLPKLISGELRLDSPEVDQAKALVN